MGPNWAKKGLGQPAMPTANPTYIPKGNKVHKLPLFEIRAAIVDRTITTFFFPPLCLCGLWRSRRHREGPRRRGGRWAGADGGGLGLEFRGSGSRGRGLQWSLDHRKEEVGGTRRTGGDSVGGGGEAVR
jgi:hypothetical protein